MTSLGKWEDSGVEQDITVPTRLKVLFLTWEYPPHIIGGLARHSEGLSSFLQKNNVEVHVVTTKPQKISEEFEEVDGVRVYRVEPLNAMDDLFLNWIGGLNLKMVDKALELAKEHQFNLIHAHDWLVGEAAINLAKHFEIPLITTIHATEYGRHSGIYTELQHFIHEKEEKLISSSDHIIVCSEFMREELSEIFSTPFKKISVIPNGVQIDLELEAKSKILLHPILHDKRNIVFSIGRLVKEKGFDLIIQAAAKMRRKDVCFVIAGTGPMYQEYESLIRKHKLEDYVYLTGFISDQQRNQLLEKSCMAIFPSRYEPFGIVALEAMKFGCPVIVSETGGLRGIVKHQQTGLFMKSDDIDSLLTQIDYILLNPAETVAMAMKGKKLVDQFYSWNRVAEMTKRIYEERCLLRTIEEEIPNIYI